jgi:hypothetical protein
MKILMVLTSHDQLGDTGQKTGFWVEELAAPYYVFKDAASAEPLDWQAPLNGSDHARENEHRSRATMGQRPK